MKFVPLYGAMAATILSVAAVRAQSPVAATPLTPAQQARLMKLGHTYTRWLLDGQIDSLAAGFDQGALEQMGGVDGIRAQADKLAEHAGAETDVVVEKLNQRKGLPQFWHEGNFSGMPNEALVIRWLLDVESGKIVGAGLGPKSSTPAPDN